MEEYHTSKRLLRRGGRHSLPFAKMKVKVKENSKTGTLFGQVNVAVISELDVHPIGLAVTD